MSNQTKNYAEIGLTGTAIPASKAYKALTSGNVFGGGGHHTQMQAGNDANINNLNLGQAGFGPAYDSNTKGSFEQNYNGILQNFTPDQLVARYAQGNSAQWATSLDKSNAAAYNAAKSALGRDPSGSELAQILPAFQQSPTYGNAILPNLVKQWQQDPSNPNNQANSSKYTDSINGVFNSMVGRDATADEIKHFGALMSTGNLDAYGLQQFVTGTPEYQGIQNKNFQTGLSTQLNTVDKNFFDQAKGDVMSQFAQNGTQNSTALDSALTSLMGQIQNQNNQYIAGISASQYGGNQQLALGNYQQTLQNFGAQQNYNRQQSQYNIDQLTGRSNQLSDYNTQKNDYMNFVNGQQPNNLLNYVNTGINAGRTAYQFMNQ